MNSKVIEIDVAEKVRQSEAAVDAAKSALAEAEAELRVWTKLLASSPSPRSPKVAKPKDAQWRLPLMEREAAPKAGEPQKRDRRPNEPWMKVLALLEAAPLGHAEFANAARQQGIERRAFTDQIRRYVNNLGLLQDDGNSYTLTERARGFLTAYKAESSAK
jgi:hypothetical protein